MADLIRKREDLKANWVTLNPLLEKGEPGVEIDTGRIKYGNGVSLWNDLPYSSLSNVITESDINSLYSTSDFGVYHYVGTGWKGLVEICFDASNKVSQIAFSSATPSYNNSNVLTWVSGKPCTMVRTYSNGSWSNWTIAGSDRIDELAEALTELGPKVSQNESNIENLQQEIDAITPITIEGDVTNAPDEEDVTTDESNLLKLKDRPTAVNQKGYKILRKGASLSSQMTDTNTIYEVRYAFDLNGGTLTVPTGSVLKFDGGMLSNGTISGNATRISAGNEQIFGDNVTISGSWNVVDAFPEWFGAKGNGVNDDAPAINKSLLFGSNYKAFRLLFTNKVYLVGNSINLSSMANVTLEGIAKNVIKKIQGNYKDMIIAGKVKNLTIKNLVFDGSYTDFSIDMPTNGWSTNEWCACMRASSETTNVLFDNNIVQNFHYGVFIGGAYESNNPRPVDSSYSTEHISITNNRFENVKAAAIDSFNQFGLFISNNYIKDCGKSSFPIAIEPSETRANMTSDPFSVASLTESYALADGVTVSDNKIYNVTGGYGGIKVYSGAIKACIKDNFFIGGARGIEVGDPVMVKIDGNTIQDARNGILISGLPGIITVSNNKVLNATEVTIRINASEHTIHESLNVFCNYFEYADTTLQTAEYSTFGYRSAIIRDNVFRNVNALNTQYKRRAAICFDSDVPTGIRCYNNRLEKSSDTNAAYFIFVPSDFDYIGKNVKIYDNVSDQPLSNAIPTSEPLHIGTTAQRPTSKKLPYLGYTYYDTTVGKTVVAKAKDNGGVITWVNMDGTPVLDTSGTFANKPTPSSAGFQYFCTSGASIDGGTTEKTNIVIYYTGSGWVDANGNAVVAKA